MEPKWIQNGVEVLFEKFLALLRENIFLLMMQKSQHGAKIEPKLSQLPKWSQN